MSKPKINVRELVEKFHDNCERIREIADNCEKEQRERTEAETTLFEALTRENQILQMKVQAATAEALAGGEQTVDTDTVLRENLLGRGQRVTVLFEREGSGSTTTTTTPPDVTPQTTAALADTGIITTSEQAILAPVRKGLIYDKVGIDIRSGLSGKLRWPKHGKAVASFADEGERLVDSAIDWGKLDMQGYRLGIAIPVTREELEDSHGIVESVIYSEMPAAVIDIINDAMFTTTGTYTAADGTTKACKVKGPFAGMASSATQFAAAVPTRKELLKMVSDVASKVDLKAPCWVMTDAMMAELRDVKIDSGSGRFLCENGMVLGYPVFTTSSIGADYVGFGDWSYQAAGFFGSWQLEADPYTLLRKNAVDFVLNTRFGTATLRSDAFALGKINKS